MKSYRIKNILVPTDFSPNARHGLHHAERIAKLAQAKITLLNVVEPIGGAASTSGMLGVCEMLEKKAQEMSRRKLERMAHATTKRSKVPVAVLAVVGGVASEVKKATRNVHADLIIMGTHGANGFVENLLGSNTYRIASFTSVPLMSVHRKMRRSGYSHIVYPVREQARALDKFAHALVFARLFNARVHILGLLHPEQKEREKNMRAQCVSVKKRFKSNGVSATTRFTYAEFFPDAIIRYAHAYSGPLVVTIQDADFHLVEVFQGTFTKRVLHTILSPVLVIPPSRLKASERQW
jgi:nucleotide-binding universal stress UspA family protein